MSEKKSASSLAGNLDKAEGYLAQFKSAPVRHFIAGESATAKSGKTFDTLCPVDNTVLAKVVAGDAADIDAAAKSAAAAFPAWRAVPGAKRRAILHAIADAIVARAEEIALVESMDTGQPIRYMEKAALRGAENYRFFADRAPGAADGLSLPDSNHINYTLRQPIGPVGIITPWNTPFMLSTWKIAPALAAGCTGSSFPSKRSGRAISTISAAATSSAHRSRPNSRRSIKRQEARALATASRRRVPV
jgi:5-carboxymethyl-2-hydroxymuconic-semialdehyde dehydrogenase